MSRNQRKKKAQSARKSRTLNVERLENRELMAGNLLARPTATTLAQYQAFLLSSSKPGPTAEYATSASVNASSALDDSVLKALVQTRLGAGDDASGEGPDLQTLAQIVPPPETMSAAEVEQLLARAAAASNSDDAIIAIVDRNGRILGVRTEQGVVNRFGADIDKLVFAIDGAVAKARTAAFFASDQAPLTSRTIRNLSQSTITQREVQSNPTVPNPLIDTPFDPSQPISRTFGPGFVAPIGVGGHFPQGIPHTPPVDLFGIEHQSRDSLVQAGPDGIKGTPDDSILVSRFNVDPSFIPAGKGLFAPESYGVTSGMVMHAQSRGIATLPGGIPLYENGTLVGGIGVFFPGPDGYADFEQNFQHAKNRKKNKPQTNEMRLNAPKVIEAEWIAFAATGGITIQPPPGGFKFGDGSVGRLSGIDPVPGYGLPFGRIDLVGITLEVFGPNPTGKNPISGVDTLLKKGQQVGQGDPNSGMNQVVDPLSPDPTLRDGLPDPEGWLVRPHASPTGASSLTEDDVRRIIEQGIEEAGKTRAAIRLDLGNIKNGYFQPGAETSMVLAVADRDGNVLGLFRMKDATIFSIDVAVAKARNTAYYADASAIQDEDLVDDDLLVQRDEVSRKQLKKEGAKIDGQNNHRPDLFKDAKSKNRYNPLKGLAFTNRTFRFLAEPRYPSGVDGSLPPIFSSLHTIGVNPKTAENTSPNPNKAPPASNFQTVYGFDAFHPGRNFRDPDNIENQNGIVFFPGSTPLYVGANLQGGFGVSGDGVDQDDVVTFAGQDGYEPPKNLRADRVFYRGVRLPFQKFNRNPQGGIE